MAEKQVTVYSNVGLGPCHQAMEYLLRQLGKSMV
jgi:hypothetical protein